MGREGEHSNGGSSHQSAKNSAGESTSGSSSSSSSLRRVAAAEAGAAFVAVAVSDFILYGIDSYKTLRQGGVQRTVNPQVLFRGAGPVVLLGSSPSLALFFGLWTPTRAYLSGTGSLNPQDLSPPAVVLGAVACALPASLVGVPADTLKKRLLVSREAAAKSYGVREAASQIYKDGGWRGFFVGTSANVTKDLPFAAIKLAAYEMMGSAYMSFKQRSGHGHGQVLSPTESSAIGAASGGIVAVATTPLDVVNTWLKSGRLEPGTSMQRAAWHIVESGGVTALFRGAALRVALTGLGSSIFWWVHSHVKTAFAGADALSEAYSRRNS
eukprot:TRINITY_DN104729_c0_g1_i1.p1 TRINITY_DN104729_c0_g1~~TRINITY_DN104729_c0_g1_i1.p1  ORF type:complete len:337 (-),score=71.14 TRINITY_DN104729_c0_g1_i1:150-1127(-)